MSEYMIECKIEQMSEKEAFERGSNILREKCAKLKFKRGSFEGAEYIGCFMWDDKKEYGGITEQVMAIGAEGYF